MNSKLFFSGVLTICVLMLLPTPCLLAKLFPGLGPGLGCSQFRETLFLSSIHQTMASQHAATLHCAPTISERTQNCYSLCIGKAHSRSLKTISILSDCRADA